jgi:hypothetical protein
MVGEVAELGGMQGATFEMKRKLGTIFGWTSLLLGLFSLAIGLWTLWGRWGKMGFKGWLGAISSPFSWVLSKLWPGGTSGRGGPGRCPLADQAFLNQGGEGKLGIYQALTFRLTVGGLSMMLMLNLFFWAMSGLYLFRKPIAAILPTCTGQIRIGEKTASELLRSWNLYYTHVTDEQYMGYTFWNTTWEFFLGRMDRSQAVDVLAAIDPWSLLSQLLYPLVILLFLANLIFVLLGLVSCQKRGIWSLTAFALAMPCYWVLISIAACKGAWQLFRNPWYWEKTIHGLDKAPGPGPS